MASKAARANVALANMRRKNETLEKAIGAVRRAAKNETAQLLTAGAVSGGVGAVVGSKVQEYLNTKGVEAGKTDGYSVQISGIPTGVFIGAGLAALGLFKMKGKAQAMLGGLGAGIAGGAYLEGVPE